MDTKFRDAAVEVASEQPAEPAVLVLSDFQLALIGGGGGDVVFA